MKNTVQQFIVILLGLILFSSCEKTVDTDKEQEYLKSEKKIIYYKGEPFSGVLVTPSKHGKSAFKDGKKDGESEGYYENGQLEYKSEWEDGKVIINERYWKNGKISIKESYKWDEEKKSGEELGYFENGQLAYKRIYKNGKRARELFYEEGGKLREEKKYDEDGFFIY